MSAENKTSVETASDSPVAHQRLVRRLVELAKRPHFSCDEDGWYNCPLSDQGCLNDTIDKTKCNCSAENHNAEVTSISERLELLTAKSPNVELSEGGTKTLRLQLRREPAIR